MKPQPTRWPSAPADVVRPRLLRAVRWLAALASAALLAGCGWLFGVGATEEVVVGVGVPNVTPSEVHFDAAADSSTPPQVLDVEVGVNLQLGQRATGGPSAVLGLLVSGLPDGVEAVVVEPVNGAAPEYGANSHVFFASTSDIQRFRVELRVTSATPLGAVSAGRHRVTVRATLGLTFTPVDPSAEGEPATSARSESSVVVDIGGAVAPGQPLQFNALPAQAQVQLTWAADAAPASYRLERADAGGAFSALATLPAPATSHLDTGVAAATRYTYRLTPVNDAGSGLPATLEVVTLAPAGNVTLALTSAGDGSGGVSSQPAGIACPGAACTMAAPPGTEVTLVALPATGSVFARWTGDDDCSDGRVTLVGATACTARFADADAVVSRLNVSVNGSGSVTTDGIACPGDCDETYPRTPPRSLALTAVPAPGHVFSGWGGDCRGSGMGTALVMDSSLACSASFQRLPDATLDVTLTGLGGHSVVSSPAGIDCGGSSGGTGNVGSCSVDFPLGQSLVLTLQGAADSQVSWSGSASGCSGSARSVTLTLGASSQGCRAAVSAPPGLDAWVELGSGAPVDVFVAGRPALAVDGSNRVVVAYLADTADRRELRVQRHDGTAWQALGGAVNAGTGSALSPSLALRADGRPVVAWADEAGAVRVSAWDGAAWLPLSQNLVIGGTGVFGSKPQLALSGSTVVVAWMQFQGLQARLALKRHDLATGGPWAGDFVPGVGTDADIAPQMALDAAGRATLLYVRLVGTGGELAARAVEETAGGWQPLCNDVAPGSGTRYANITFGFGVHRGSDGIATAWVIANDLRGVLARRCEDGLWRNSDWGNGDGVALPIDNLASPLLAVATLAGAPRPSFAYALNTGYQVGSRIGTHTRRAGSDLWADFWPALELGRTGPSGAMAAALAPGGEPVVANVFDNGTGAYNELRVHRYFP